MKILVSLPFRLQFIDEWKLQTANRCADAAEKPRYHLIACIRVVVVDDGALNETLECTSTNYCWNDSFQCQQLNYRFEMIVSREQIM